MYYFDPVSKYPEPKEKPGYFVGFANSSGDALTYKVLTENLKTVLVQSVVQPATDMTHRNRRL